MCECAAAYFQKRHMILTSEKCTDFFLSQANDEDFDEFIMYMTSGPLIALVLTKRHAISDWLTLIGPPSAALTKLPRDW